MRLTPAGRAAVTTLRVEGSATAELIGMFFQGVSQQPVNQLACGQIRYGRWKNDLHQVGEDVVISRRATDAFEIHSHGGRVAQDSIIQSLGSLGVRPVEWQDWAATHTLPPLQVAARVALATTRTEVTAQILIDQLNGALQEALDGVRVSIEMGHLREADEALQDLQAYEPVGRALTKPFRVAVAGPPNAGKSSLINRMLGFERAIVSDQPGTTRDLLTFETAYDGWPIVLTDTAGLRESKNALEHAGIELALSYEDSVDLVLLVFDITEPNLPLMDHLRERHPDALVAYNKIDLVESDQNTVFHGEPISALTGFGIEPLWQHLLRALVPSIPPPGAAVPYLPEQTAGIHQARLAIHNKQPDQASQSILDIIG